TIGVIYALSGVFATAASFVAPAVARWGALQGLVALRGLTAPIFLLFFIHPALPIVFAAFIGRNILGQITGTLENAFTMERVPARLRAATANWRQFAFNAGWTVASVAAGAVVSRYGFDPVFVASGVLTLVGVLTWYRRFIGKL